ncbi:hypothetical protein EV424DRAFT_1412148 [Suillus variegatus]|nr:hypothetical protein EV424DRAFT_1412148 [Suillus variegatus]
MMGTVAPTESIEGSTINISPETRKQAISLSKERILSIVFSEDALAYLVSDKKCIIRNVISEVRLGIPALLVATRWTANEKDVANIWCAVTKFHTSFATIIRHAVVMGYSLFPPPGCVIPPDTFRVDRIRRLVVDNALAFMHQYTFTADGALVINSKFTNPFVLHVLTRLIWCSPFGLHTFLDESPHRQLHYAIGAAGAITESALMEQGLIQLTKGRITPQMTFSTFTNIVLSLDRLDDNEKSVFDEFTDSIVVCGRSQQTNDELSDFVFE